MIRIHAQNTIADCAKTSSNFETGVIQVLSDAAKFAKANAQSSQKFNDRTGKLRGSIKTGGGGFKTRIESRTSYSLFVEAGTRPHTISARSGMLSFVIAGRRIFARSVKHHGTAPRPFMGDAAEITEYMLPQWMERMVDRIMR